VKTLQREDDALGPSELEHSFVRLGIRFAYLSFRLGTKITKDTKEGGPDEKEKI
jgi:hypothetical protein